MQATAEKQFNMHFSVVADEYLGKGSATRFTNGGKRFTATKILCAALLSTRQKVLGDGCTTSYTDFTSELCLARSTTARNVGELTRDGTFKRNKKSTYSAAYSIDEKHGVPVYHFLRTEKFNGKRLSGNAVLYVSFLIRFYLNPEREQKYFIGGEKRAAKTINAPQSTAHGFINELLRAGLIHRFQMCEKTGKVKEGKGINSDYLTVYVVDDKILKAVKAIRKQINKQAANQQALKKLFASEQQQEQRAKPVEQNRRKSNLLEQWQSTYDKIKEREALSAETIAKSFANNFAFNQLKSDYISTLNKYFNAIRQSGGEDTKETQELKKRLDVILSDILNLLLSHNIQRGELPDDWQTFIRDLIRS